MPYSQTAGGNAPTALLALLRLALDNRATLPPMADSGWEAVFALAQRHAVAGMLFPTVSQFPEALRPPRHLLLSWFALAEQTKRLNRRVDADAVRLTAAFDRQGWPNVVLKGQGVARFYPDPSLRAPGDIDLYVAAPRPEVVDFLRAHSRTPLMESYKDVACRPFGGTLAEVHFRPAVMTCPWAERRWRRFMAAQRRRLFRQGHMLSGGTIHVPHAAFDAVFLAVHIYRHLFYEGVGLRQVTDYACLLRHGLAAEERREAAATLRRLGLRRFSAALSWVMAEGLGLGRDCLLFAPDASEGRFLLAEIMRGGNFRRSDTGREPVSGGRLRRFVAVAAANAHLFRHYPREAVFCPLFTLWQYAWRLSHGQIRPGKTGSAGTTDSTHRIPTQENILK